MSAEPVQFLAEEWIKSSKEEDRRLVLFDECHEEPEIAWLAILRIVEEDLKPKQTELLAAGPMEDLLSLHGPDFIDRVEKEAANNPKFNYLLGGVWKLKMTDDVWERVQSARREVW